MWSVECCMWKVILPHLQAQMPTFSSNFGPFRSSVGPFSRYCTFSPIEYRKKLKEKKVKCKIWISSIPWRTLAETFRSIKGHMRSLLVCINFCGVNLVCIFIFILFENDSMGPMLTKTKRAKLEIWNANSSNKFGRGPHYDYALFILSESSVYFHRRCLFFLPYGST